MKTRNLNLKNKTLALGLIASALTAGTAFADHGYANRTRGADVSGTVVLSKEIPGGVITVGATIGRERPVVVEERKVVVVKQEERCEPRKVVIIKEQPREVVVVREAPRKVVIVKERPVEKVVIIKQRGKHGRVIEKRIVTRGYDRDDHHDRWERDDRDWDDHHDRRGRGDHGDWDRGDRDFSHGKQVSVQQQGPDGNYHYYEDAHQVSIQDNRGGVNRHVYVQK